LKLFKAPLNGRVEIDYLSSFSYEYICIFTIFGEGVATVYLTHLEPLHIRLPKRQLTKFLLENVRRATVVRSFELAD
jgi:hypothetical protein